MWCTFAYNTAQNHYQDYHKIENYIILEDAYESGGEWNFFKNTEKKIIKEKINKLDLLKINTCIYICYYLKCMIKNGKKWEKAFLKYAIYFCILVLKRCENLKID